MKICLIRPPKLMVKDALPIGSQPPLGLALLAGVLKEKGHQVSAIDGISERPKQFNDLSIPVNSQRFKSTTLATMGLSFEEIAEKIPEDVEMIGFSSMFSCNWLCDRALIAFLAPLFPHATLIAGGESVTGMAEVCLDQLPELKVCVLGEGEETIMDLIDALQQGKSLETVSGIACRNSDGQIIKTPKRTRIRELDSLPLPAWEYFPLENYKRHVVRRGEPARKTLPVLATRGCPYECTFCTSPDMWGTRYFMRKPIHVMEEFEFLYNTYGINNFLFYDLTAIINKRWIIEFASLLIERNLDITWKIPAGTRSEAIDSEVSGYLYRSGCFSITYAPESGSERMLKLIKKKVDLNHMLVSMRNSQKEGMFIFINIILGLPDETHKDVWATFRFLSTCAKVGVDDMGLAIFRPYPGSELFYRLEKEGLVQIKNDDYFMESLLIIDTGFTGAIYNKNMHPFWYHVYQPLAYIAFYGTSYMYKPLTFFRAIKNIISNQPDSILENNIALRVQHWKRSLRPTNLFRLRDRDVNLKAGSQTPA